MWPGLADYSYTPDSADPFVRAMALVHQRNRMCRGRASPDSGLHADLGLHNWVDALSGSRGTGAVAGTALRRVESGRPLPAAAVHGLLHAGRLRVRDVLCMSSAHWFSAVLTHRKLLRPFPQLQAEPRAVRANGYGCSHGRMGPNHTHRRVQSTCSLTLLFLLKPPLATHTGTAGANGVADQAGSLHLDYRGRRRRSNSYPFWGDHGLGWVLRALAERSIRGRMGDHALGWVLGAGEAGGLAKPSIRGAS